MNAGAETEIMRQQADAESCILQVKGLCSGYGKVPVLRGASFSVAANEIVGVLGHNGMGKTTLLRTLMGLVPATGGSILWGGENIGGLPTEQRNRAGIGYVPQGRGIFPGLTVLENLLFAYQDDGGGEEEKVLEEILLDFPRLRDLLEREGGLLSGGEQQMLALARCLMGLPTMLLLDEPTEGIQPSIVESIGDSLRRLCRDKGMSVLVVEQNFDFISNLADRVLVLERGRIKTELSSAELSDQSVIEQFLGFSRQSRNTRPASGTTQTRPAPQIEEETPGLASAKVASQENNMSVKRPALSDMRNMATRLGMSMTDDELAGYMTVIEPYIQGYDALDSMPDHLPQVRYPRAPGYRPGQDENPLNAWYYKTDIKGAAHGPLSGKRIAVKDTVCVAGIPMMNGASIMEGYIPEVDATIVTRMLDAGATIAGKATCEYLCLSGGSHTSASGPVHNPYKRGYMAGGSSSGSAALVSSREVDMAIAGDQGGSIRIPSCNCGCYGMKPTHGLVPYSGVMPIEQTIDHVGPVTNSVYENALLLEVIAGADGLDPRQYAPQVHRYTEAIGKGVADLRIGVLKEGFGRRESESDVDAKVRGAADKLREAGANVEEVSVPEHMLAPALWTAITVEGLQDMMMHGNSAGTNYRGLFLPSMIDHFANWRARADELSSTLKACMFIGEHFLTQYRGRYYGKAQNLMRMVSERYMATFKSHDLLLLPTLPMKAQQIPPQDAPLELYVQRAFEMIGNTAPFNAAGFPAMNVPCGMSDGLPIGLQLVAPNYEELTIYQAADAFEKLGDWRTF